MIVDETQLEAGTLNSVGVENARLLQNLTELQKVTACCLAILSFGMVVYFIMLWFFICAIIFSALSTIVTF